MDPETVAEIINTDKGIPAAHYVPFSGPLYENTARNPELQVPRHTKMYERLSPRYRHAMTDKQLISTVKYFAGTKPVFFLSEILEYLDEPRSVNEIFATLQPRLGELRLSARKTGSDYEISRILPPQQSLISEGEEERISAFFNRGAIPSRLDEALGQYITKKAGKEYTEPAVLERLRKAIVAQKDDYWRPAHLRTLQYAKGYSILGYLAYHFPVYFMQTEHLFSMLARDGLLKPSMNILDVGTGPGVVPLAIADFYSRLETRQATVHSLERSEEHREAFMFLREHCTEKGANASIKAPIAMDITNPDLGKVPGKIDLMIFSNVLNELPGDSPESGAEIVAKLAERLSPDGTILITEPADEENATRMRSLTVALTRRGFSIYGPCAFLWGTACEAPRCWSFTSASPIRLTKVMQVLAQGPEGYRYVNTDIKYSYAVLRRDGLTKPECRLPADAKFLRMSKLHLHVGKRINIAVAKMSGELGNAKTHVIKICDGTAKTPVYAIIPSYHITPENELIVKAPYGSILELRGVLVRFNKAHNAYNLLVSRNTGINIHDAIIE